MKQKRIHQQDACRFKRFVRKAYSAFNSMHRVVNIGVVTGCILTSMIVPTTAKSQTTTSEQQQKVMEKELEEVMVTASRVETPLNQSAKLITVITKEQISRAPVSSVQDLLVYAANVDVVQRGGHGVQADISIRGGSFDQNAILLNGVNLSNPHTGHYSLDIPVNLSDIERIEIIHGPSALIYGASAFSGGINIITKKTTDKEAYLSVGAGMHKLRNIEMRGALITGSVSNSLSVSSSSSDGYTANSDYDIYNVLWQSRIKLRENSKLDLQLGYNDKKYGANTFYSAKFPNQYEQTSTYMGSVKGEFGSKLKVVPIIYWDRHHDQFDLVKDTDFGRNYHRSDTYGANLIFIYKSKFGNTSFGSELRREDMMSTVLGLPMVEPHRKYKKYDDRTITSFSAEHTLSIDKFTFSVGVLLNHNTLQKGKYELYPSVNLAYQLTDSWKVFTSWNQSSRMPTFTDLYYTTETHKGNDGLKPEKSEAWDFGARYSGYDISFYATGFLMWGTNMIDWVKEDPTSIKWASWNLTEINTQGIETGVKLSLANVLPSLGERSSLAVDYARMHQTNDTKGLISLYALNYLRDKFTVTFNHQLYRDLYLNWYFRYQKRMGTYEKYENLVKVGDEYYPAFSTLDLKLVYGYKGILFNLELNNIYNTHYFDKGNVPQPGFWLTGGISYTFK